LAFRRPAAHDDPGRSGPQRGDVGPESAVQFTWNMCPKKKSILPCIRALRFGARRILLSGVCLRRTATHACTNRELRHRWAGAVVAVGVVHVRRRYLMR
jgi:hypothetical protein